MDYYKESLIRHKKYKGKVEIRSKFPISNKDDLSTAYTPGVAEPCREIHKDKSKVYDYTWKGNTVAVISDGSAVLGLGDIGPEAALPVMEGKAILFKEFGNVDAIPLVLDTKDVDEIVSIITKIAPTFGGINLEDISAPRCFLIEQKLKHKLDIPVFHDDQHGTAVVLLAGLINACKVVDKRLENLKIVINGAGAAGIAITKLLKCLNIDKRICTTVKEIILCDSKGIISKGRKDLNEFKQEILKITNPNNITGMLEHAMVNADVFIGVSKGNVVTKKMVQVMAPNAIIFAMANPTPEIMPDEAKKAGAAVVATGRSDFPNQVNNVLGFPGIFRGALDARAKSITSEMKVAAAHALANYLKKPTKDNILPCALDKNVAIKIAEAVKKASKK